MHGSGLIIAIAVSAIVCALLCGLLAQATGRDAVVWALGGLIAGVLALVVLVLSVIFAGGGAYGRKRCPDCAELVQGQARVCRHCGHEFADETPSSEELELRRIEEQSVFARSLRGYKPEE